MKLLFLCDVIFWGVRLWEMKLFFFMRLYVYVPFHLVLWLSLCLGGELFITESLAQESFFVVCDKSISVPLIIKTV